MQFGANDMQPAQFVDALAKANVGAAASHVGRYGHFADFACSGHDFRLGRYVSSIQHLMIDPTFVQ